MTSRKPTLTVVGTSPNSPAPPRKLGKYGRHLWDRVHREYRLEDCGSIEMLAQVCGAVDRIESLRAGIDRDGEIVKTRNGPRAHPGMRDELAGRAFVVRTLARLGLSYDTLKPVGRPSTGIGWTGDDD
jgi:hypothetical protein